MIYAQENGLVLGALDKRTSGDTDPEVRVNKGLLALELTWGLRSVGLIVDSRLFCTLGFRDLKVYSSLAI